MSPTGRARHRSHRPAQVLRRPDRRRRRVLHRRGGRDLRHPRPERRGQDHHRRVRRGAADARRGPRPGRSASTRVADQRRVARVLGVQLQESELPDKLTVREALELYASFYPRPRRLARRSPSGSAWPRSAGTRFAKLSGGQKQRLSIALALVGNPRVVGPRRADHRPRPAGPPGHLAADRGRPRRAASPSCWSPTSWRRPSGCATGSRVIDTGRVAALDTPAGLIRRSAGGHRISFTPVRAAGRGRAAALPEARLGRAQGRPAHAVRHRRDRRRRHHPPRPPARSPPTELRVDRTPPSTTPSSTSRRRARHEQRPDAHDPRAPRRHPGAPRRPAHRDPAVPPRTGRPLLDRLLSRPPAGDPRLDPLLPRARRRPRRPAHRRRLRPGRRAARHDRRRRCRPCRRPSPATASAASCAGCPPPRSGPPRCSSRRCSSTRGRPRRRRCSRSRSAGSRSACACPSRRFGYALALLLAVRSPSRSAPWSPRCRPTSRIAGAVGSRVLFPIDVLRGPVGAGAEHAGRCSPAIVGWTPFGAAAQALNGAAAGTGPAGTTSACSPPGRCC